MPLKLITAPTVEPITVTEVKKHLRIESESFADNISSTQSIAPGAHVVAAAYSLIGTAVDVLGSQTAVMLMSGTNGVGGTVDVKIQESDDNITYTDWYSFTQVTEANDNATYEKEYTGAKQYIKVVCTVAGATCSFGVSMVEYAPYSDEDTWITEQIETVRNWCQHRRGESFITQTWELSLDHWPECGYIELPYGPLQSVTSVKYYDTADTEYTWSSTLYTVNTYYNPGRIVPNDSETFPSTTLRTTNGIVVQYICGYGDAATSVPAEIKLAMKMIIGHYYENREYTYERILREVPMVMDLLDVERKAWF